MRHDNPLNRPAIIQAVQALFEHGRHSEQYKLAIKRVIAAGYMFTVQQASPHDVAEVRAALGIDPMEQR